MKEITRQILRYLDNQSTKVEEKEDFKGNYYSYITDTIYISKTFFNKEQKGQKNINKLAGNVVTVCHECIHSVQKRSLHILNTVFSNVSVVMTLVYIILSIIGKQILVLKILALSLLVFAIVIRLILEVGAVNGSTKLAQRLIKEEKIEKLSTKDILDTEDYINKHKILALAHMVLDKIIILILLSVI